MDYMLRAMELAERGRGQTSPNPVVGAVIVKNGEIIAEGWHEKYGGLHAEANAFKNATEDVSGADMYVTLEPCSHYGKQPPCAKAIIERKIKRVFIGALDPNPLVGGKGAQMLKDAGIEVKIETGARNRECLVQNEVFFKYISQKTPFVVMKTAMTLDGKIAAKTGDSRWVTGEASRRYAHKLRNDLSAIMVGIGTVLADNPSLTCRDYPNGKNPVRIAVDSKLRIPLDAAMLKDDGTRRIIAAANPDEKKAAALRQMGVEVINCPNADGKVDLKLFMRKIAETGIDSVLLEGGSELNFSAMRSGVVDKAISFVAPKICGGGGKYTPVGGEGVELMKDAIPLYDISVEKIDTDVMITAYVNDRRR